ncbi:cyclic diguanylate phosphodiesterase [Neisseriaceae bacterium JH1-16]|nr:cyclic diguanylate phosphodiesterase [Neisseriaceae bacterium JH1-16]
MPAKLQAFRALFPPSRRLPLLAALVVALLCPAIGTAVAYYQASTWLRQQADHRVTEIIQATDDILLHAQAAGRRSLPLLDQPCLVAREQLVMSAALTPYVRSLALYRGPQGYCSSLSGPARFSYPRERLRRNGNLLLMPGNSLTPQQPLLLLRIEQGDRGVLVGLLNHFVAETLIPTQTDPESVSFLTVGSRYLNREGQALDSAPATPSVVAIETSATSKHFPALHATVQVDQPTLNRFFWQHYSLLLGLLLAGGLAGGLLTHRLLTRRDSAERELRRALTQGEFEPFYQPVLQADDGSCRGVEVLIRWRHPDKGLIRPDLFIPLAEEAGLIVPITRQLMQRIRADLQTLSLPDGFKVGVNLAPVHLHEATLIDDCRLFQQTFAARDIRLVLELTERGVVDNDPEVQATMAELRTHGVQLAIDDFGTGHSSLAYLHKLNVDYLKIDQGFVRTIGSDSLGVTVLETIIELAHRLHLEMVAEGVETEQQRRYLQQNGVQFLQGFLFARPMPIDELRCYLASK